MSALLSRFHQLKLNQKFTLIVFCLVLIPVVFLAIVLFSNTQRVMMVNKIKDVEDALYPVQTGIEKTVDLCNMTTQVFQNSTSLREFLTYIKQEETVTTEYLVSFYNNDFTGLERLVAANPYLYQVRIFYANEKVPEMMPLLYHQSRMQNLAWAQKDWESATWQYNYADTLFPPEVTKPTQHIMSLVTTIDDYEAGSLGVLEVSVRMDEIIPGLFNGGHSGDSALISDEGLWFYDYKSQAFWNDNRQFVAPLLDLAPRDIETTYMPIGGEGTLITVVPLSQIGGYYLLVTPPGDVSSQLTQFRNWYFLGTILLLALLALTVNFVVKAMLRRFYLVFSTITTIQNGDINVTVPELGNDEVGLLAKQFNIMMARIVKLMEDNVNREILAKNSEIRALQSQINAHFIYNVLESIKMMAEMDEEYEIADAIQSLGALLRYSMRWTTPTASLADEIENVSNYLALINLRFDYQVTLRSTIEPELLKQKIPKMTLQPIVENAIVHGIEDLAEDTIIDIYAQIHPENQYLTLFVQDYGKGMDAETIISLKQKLSGKMEQQPGKSIGLKNVHDRIVMAYGDEFGIDIESVPNAYTKIAICLPNYKIEEVSGEKITYR